MNAQTDALNKYNQAHQLEQDVANAQQAFDEARNAQTAAADKLAAAKAYQQASVKAENAAKALNDANNTLNVAQKALDEARNAQTAAADQLGTTNPDVAALQNAANDAQTKLTKLR
ncbi:hypothetical protein LR3_03520 [Limosilactobacillus reuteri]|uniref:Uncharacterized protein n=1 Tax=Limosilactobacillus reuteri TaxID=1598 RepID=A0A073JQC6_LIMRT|nr:hypothetical protein LR3_03520 [Limosilactobacillus reuteri]